MQVKAFLKVVDYCQTSSPQRFYQKSFRNQFNQLIFHLDIISFEITNENAKARVFTQNNL